MKLLISITTALLAVNTLLAADATKKLLIVTTTTGFRHSSIPTAQKILTQLGAQSGLYTVDYAEQPPGKPNAPKVPEPIKPDAPDADKQAHTLALVKFHADEQVYTKAVGVWEEQLKVVLRKLSPENLKNYDGVVFASTTGNLPIPDRDGFLNWIKAGHAFIGIHAATDTYHGWPEYIDMIGGEFAHHGKQVAVDCIIQDPQNPATAGLGKVWHINQEEIYQFKNYDPTKVHDLLILDKHPESGADGHYGVCWCKHYGEGRVFYTSIGHREDIWDTDPSLKDRKNSVEISKAYQQHILGGIKWALGQDVAN